MNKVLLTAISMLSIAFAGCADEPSYGPFTLTTPSADYSTLTLVFNATPASNSYPGGDPNACQADTVGQPAQAPAGCTAANTTISMEPEDGATLPWLGRDDATYKVVMLVDGEVEELGDMENHGQTGAGVGHYAFPATTFDSDMSNATEVQLLYNGDLIASAPTAGGGGPFALDAGLEAITSEVTFTENQVTMNTTRIPAGIELEAWLISVDEAGAKTHAVRLQQLTPGESIYNIDTVQDGMVTDYQQIHIHVTGTDVNVAVADLPTEMMES